jgi:hypothetical protein
VLEEGKRDAVLAAVREQEPHPAHERDRQAALDPAVAVTEIVTHATRLRATRRDFSQPRPVGGEKINTRQLEGRGTNRKI